MKKLLAIATPTRYCYIQFVYACLFLKQHAFFFSVSRKHFVQVKKYIAVNFAGLLNPLG